MSLAQFEIGHRSFLKAMFVFHKSRCSPTQKKHSHQICALKITMGTVFLHDNLKEFTLNTFKVVIFIYLYIFIYYTFNTDTMRNHKVETKSG